MIEDQVQIPADGLEHPCVCGQAGYWVCDFDGTGEPAIFDALGRQVHVCWACGAELLVGDR